MKLFGRISIAVALSFSITSWKKPIDILPEQVALNLIDGMIYVGNSKSDIVYFSGYVDVRESFISSFDKDLNIALKDTSGFSKLYGRNDTLNSRVSLDCSQLNKKKIIITNVPKKKVRTLKIHRAIRMNGDFSFVRAIVTNGMEGIVYYFFVGKDETYFVSIPFTT